MTPGRLTLRGAVADLVDGPVRTDVVLGDITAVRTELMSLADAQALAAQVAKRPDVVWAQADALMQADERADVAPPVAVNDPLYGNLYNLWDSRDAGNAEVAPKRPPRGRAAATASRHPRCGPPPAARRRWWWRCSTPVCVRIRTSRPSWCPATT